MKAAKPLITRTSLAKGQKVPKEVAGRAYGNKVLAGGAEQRYRWVSKVAATPYLSLRPEGFRRLEVAVKGNRIEEK